MKKISLRLLFCIILSLCFVTASSGSNIYTTWENMEIDKCASAWLIKKFIDKNAVFKFFPKGELIIEGIPFDVPEAEIRRYHNLSAFEYLMKKYDIGDPAVRKIGEIIHDIEINYWGTKAVKDSQKINDAVQEIIETSTSAEKSLEKSFIFFDKLYSDFKPTAQK